MADKEKNMPIQDPENLENEIKDLEPTADESVVEEPVAEPTEEPVDEIPAEEATEEVAEEAPAEEATAEEATEEVAEEPAEEAPVEETAEESLEETPAEEATEEVTEEAPAEEATEEVAEEAPAEEATAEEATEEVAEEPAEEAPAEEATEEVADEAPVEKAPAEESTEGEPTDEEVVEGEAVEGEASEEETEAEAAEGEETEGEAAEDEAAEEESAEEESEESEDSLSDLIDENDCLKFDIGVNENGELYIIQPSSDEEPEEESEETDGESDEEGTEETQGEAEGDDADQPAEDSAEDTEEDSEEDSVDPDDLIIHEEVVEAIRKEGAKINNDDFVIKTYLKHSRDAIKNFEVALRLGQRALETNRDDKEAPVILVGIIKICGKILEIRCNNLENLTRVRAHNYIKQSRMALHEEIERYNEYVITYGSITGEQLTRLSTFLPENISSGKSLSVVPVLSYVESYIQILPDSDEEHDEGSIMLINPELTADEVLCNVKLPKSRLGCSCFIRKIKKAAKKLENERTRINKLIAKNRVLRKRYESEIESLEICTPVAERTTEAYKNRVFATNVKYGKKLSGINTARTANAFARTRQRLIVNRMALERERLVLAYECVRNVFREGNQAQRRTAQRLFVEAIRSYNKTAEVTSRATGTTFDLIPEAIVEYVRRGDEVQFPTVAYKRQLIEQVGPDTRQISMTLREDIVPNEEVYNESSARILDRRNGVVDVTSLSNESIIVDRASAISKIILESLNESADMVLTADELQQFEVKSRRASKYFKRALKGTEKAIRKAFDEHGVVTALVENLRVISNLIEVKRLDIAVATRLKRNDAARNYGRALYKYIELYNGRAIDYMSIVGEQFSRITTATSKELVGNANKLKVPVITYKDNYIEVFPKDPLQDSTYEKPRLWRKGVYTPLMMHHYRLTENRSVETTVINSPFVFDVMIDELQAISWWHPIGIWQHMTIFFQPIVAWWNRICTNAEIWFVDESLVFSKSGLRGREKKNDRKKIRFERKLKRLNHQRDAKILALETVVHENDRHIASYQKKIYKINTKFSRKIYRLKIRWMEQCSSRNAARLLLERLVLERERLAGINKVLLKYRNYGRLTFFPNILVRYKKKFIEAINAHNKTAELLSDMIGVKLSQVSTSVADEIVRYGKMIKFPEIVCCREVIETVDGRERTVGDRWHGYGLYTGTSGSPAENGKAPVMSVGAMGYATDMGVPFLKADFDGMTMLGMTAGGVPLIGFSQTGETSIPFTGTPMMLSGADSSVVLDAGQWGQDSLMLGAANVADPHSGINRRGVDAEFTDDLEEDAKDIHSGCTVETPIDLETKMIEERFRRSLRARSMTSVDNIANWWKLVGSEINVWLMRKLAVRPQGFLRALLPPKDAFLELINTKLTEKDAVLLRYIARVGGIIEIECKKLYSATKTGIRRSQRVWSSWLHEDIQEYNKLVKEFNSAHERYMHLEPLSLNIPDTIRFRTEERPAIPQILSFRNRVKLDDKATPLTTDDIYNRLIEYARGGALRYAGPLRRLWSKLVTIPRLNLHDKLGNRGRALSIASKVILKRSARTYLHRQDNEYRHYRIRYEKARNMKRYNKRTLRAVGVANDPIKYQARVHKVLRKYLASNFRIDYNMRIRQLVYRALSIDTTIYWSIMLALIAVVAISAVFFASSPALQVIVMAVLVWAALPIIFLLLRIVYDIVLLLVSIVLLFTRNIWLIKYGARDVERNRYGAILDCFVTEQYRLLMACEKLRQKPKSTSAKKMLIATVNDYNKRATVYSEILRVPIKTIETTSLIDKLVADVSHPLPEIQNFVYIRELVERVDVHQRGKTLKDRELGELVEQINQVINGINLSTNENQVAVDFLQGAMERLIGYIQTDIKPTQNDRFELKRDLIEGISQFDISEGNKELFAANVIKVVDQLGGKDSRRIIGILAEDGMIV